MKRKRHSPDQVIAKLREVEGLLSAGTTLAEAAKRLGVSEQTLIRWRNAYGGLKAQDMKKLKELERENQRLRKVVSDQALDIEMLKEVAKGNF
jgi:transposase-like protein